MITNRIIRLAGPKANPLSLMAWPMNIMTSLLIAAFAAMFSGVCFADIVGRASVIDGDTIEIHGLRIRLHGVDAPEKGQPCFDAANQPYRCGQKAAMALDEFCRSVAGVVWREGC